MVMMMMTTPWYSHLGNFEFASQVHDNNDDNDDNKFGLIVLQQMFRLLVLVPLLYMIQSRDPSVFDQRLNWEEYVRKHGNRQFFRRHLRMTVPSFNKLLSYIREDLEVDQEMASLRGGVIIPEICLYCTLRWLAGGSYLDIYHHTGISRPSFYRILWKTIKAIVRCTNLEIKFPKTTEQCEAEAKKFKLISTGEAIANCVSVVYDTKQEGGEKCSIIFLWSLSMPRSEHAGCLRCRMPLHFFCDGGSRGHG
jgi:hypothetical protein